MNSKKQKTISSNKSPNHMSLKYTNNIEYIKAKINILNPPLSNLYLCNIQLFKFVSKRCNKQKC